MPPSTPRPSSALLRDHAPEAVQERLDRPTRHGYLRDFVYGAIDGAVTTFAVVCGVEGAALPSRVVIILGVANLVADGASMAVSNFLGTRAEQQLRDRARREEHRHIALVPEGEREEIRQIFARKGFAGDDLERAVAIITDDVDRWVETMLREEFDLPLGGPSPWRAGLATFVAFLVVGVVPLLAFLADAGLGGSVTHPFAWSIALTGIAFFAVGVAKARFVGRRPLVAGTETLLAGGVAAALAYGIGALLRGVA